MLGLSFLIGIVLFILVVGKHDRALNLGYIILLAVFCIVIVAATLLDEDRAPEIIGASVTYIIVFPAILAGLGYGVRWLTARRTPKVTPCLLDEDRR